MFSLIFQLTDCMATNKSSSNSSNSTCRQTSHAPSKIGHGN